MYTITCWEAAQLSASGTPADCFCSARFQCWCAPSYLKVFSFWSQKSTKQCFSVFHFPVSAPKELLFISSVCHIFCHHLYCLLEASGAWCVRSVPSHEGTAPGGELYMLTSPGVFASTACLPTYLRTDSTKTLKAFTWIHATNASLKFTLSQRSNGPCENRHNSTVKQSVSGSQVIRWSSDLGQMVLSTPCLSFLG